MLKTLDKEILSMLPLLQSEEKESLLGVIKAFVKSRIAQKDYEFIEAYNIELNEAEAEYERGEFITQEELRKEIKNW